MLNFLSIVLGGLALIKLVPQTQAALGFEPLSPLVLAAIGAALGLFSDRKAGRNFNLIVMVFAILRLYMEDKLHWEGWF